MKYPRHAKTGKSISKGVVKPQRSPRRTFTGCWSCRTRRVKCDERIPSCSPCRKIGKPCAGYEQSLVWVTSNQKKYQHGGRRYLDPCVTWKGFATLDADSIDSLIGKCDSVPEISENEMILLSPFSIFRSSRPPEEEEEEEEENVEEVEAPMKLDDLSNAWAVEDFPVLTPLDFFTSTLKLLTPRTESSLSSGEASLFHQYVSQVAPILLPLNDIGNPWTSYPAMALHYSSNGQKYLKYALMAHAAIFLANMDTDKENMLVAGGKYYVLAMEELRQSIEEDRIDYVGVLTTMMTFLFIEHFRGSSETWRRHYDAAWKFLRQQRKLRMWTISDDAWYATQSFYLLRIMSETSFVQGEPSRDRQTLVNARNDILLSEFSTNNHFGYTMGASYTLMSCISDINKYSQQGLMFGADEVNDRIIGNIREQLEVSKNAIFLSPDLGLKSHADAGEISSSQPAKQAHLRAYTAAALIYFHQEFFGLPPMAMAPYIYEVLDSISIFTKLTGGNYNLWPIFIAAVEAYKEEDIRKFKEIFKDACSVGMANRVQAQTVVERIWKIRDVQAAQTGQEKGLIKVEWKKVMRSLEIDVVLT